MISKSINIKYLLVLSFAILISYFSINLLRAIPANNQRYYPLLSFSNADLGMKRGSICDVNDTVLVESRTAFKLYAKPKHFADNIDLVAQIISEELNIPITSVIQKLRSVLNFNSNRNGVSFKKAIPPDLQKRLQNRLDKSGVKGLRFERDYQRIYPHGSTMSSLLGLLVDGHGAGGIEQMMNHELSAKRKTVFYRPAYLVNGHTVKLTISNQVQQIVEKELNQFCQSNQITDATMVMANPLNGNILTMTQWPGFNPVNRDASSFNMQNRNAIDGIAPGSLLDPFVKAILLNQKYKSLEDSSPEYETINQIELTNLVQKSVPSVLFQELLKFGFDSRTGIGLAEEGKGITRHPDRYDDFNQFPFSYRQLIFPTTLQLLRAYCTLANQGCPLNLNLIYEVKDYNGNLVKMDTDHLNESIVSRKAADNVLSDFKSFEIDTGKKGERFLIYIKEAQTSNAFYDPYSKSVFSNMMVAFSKNDRYPFVAVMVAKSKNEQKLPINSFDKIITRIVHSAIN